MQTIALIFDHPGFDHAHHAAVRRWVSKWPLRPHRISC